MKETYRIKDMQWSEDQVLLKSVEGDLTQLVARLLPHVMCSILVLGGYT